MSEIKQLPLLFKLFLKGKFVGYECAMQNGDDRHFDWFHSPDGKEWLNINCELWSNISHDEKRQSTGFHDIHGEEIYFGDKLKSPYTSRHFIVQYKNGKTMAVNERIYIDALEFSGRELVK